MIRAITPQESPNSVLYLLDLENVWANKDVLQELEEIEKDKPWVVIKLGGILSNYKLVGPNVRRLLLKRANYEAMTQKKRRHNFGHFVLSLTDKKIPRGMFEIEFFLNFRFSQIYKKQKIPLLPVRIFLKNYKKIYFCSKICKSGREF